MEALLMIIGLFALFVAGVAVLGLIISYPVMLLWNGCLVPAIVGINDITWLQAWGITVLFGILFKTHTSSKSKD